MKLRKTLSVLSATALLASSMAVMVSADAAKAPDISISSGEKVTYGTTVTIKNNDESHVYIYYTTDGSDPTSGSKLYTSPITVTGDVTVKAIAVNTTNEASSVTKASIDVLPELKFTDAASCSAIEYALGVLIENDVIVNSGEFNPGKVITYKDMFRMLRYAGFEIDASDYDINEDTALTNSEMVSFLYDYMTEEEMIEAKEANTVLLKFRMNKFREVSEEDYALYTTLMSYNIIDRDAYSPNASATNSSLAYAVAGMLEIDAE